MSAAPLLKINDGTLALDVPSCSMYSGSTNRADTATGHGIIEYADGSAKRWVRFEARSLIVSGNGPAPHGLWDLDLTVPTWAVSVASFENDFTLESWVVVPARPVDTRDIVTGRTGWSLTMRSAQAEP